MNELDWTQNKRVPFFIIFFLKVIFIINQNELINVEIDCNKIYWNEMGGPILLELIESNTQIHNSFCFNFKKILQKKRSINEQR